MLEEYYKQTALTHTMITVFSPLDDTSRVVSNGTAVVHISCMGSWAHGSGVTVYNAPSNLEHELILPGVSRSKKSLCARNRIIQHATSQYCELLVCASTEAEC